MPRPRTFSRISDSLHRQLNSYALATSAAGVSLLALAEPAEAKIVYTPANTPIRGEITLDLNHDGITDFGLCWSNTTYGRCSPPAARPPCGFGHQALWALPPKTESQQNQIFATSHGYAAALPAGLRIGPKRQFSPGSRLMAFWTSCPSYRSGGPWDNVTNRYLGLKFIIKGKTHYGWARLSVQVGVRYIHATLTGYAYETIPNKAIIAGKTHGKDVITVRDASLGHLARGASAIAAWRAKQY